MKTKTDIEDGEYPRIRHSVETFFNCADEEERQPDLYEPRVIAQIFEFDGPRRIEQLTKAGAAV